MSTSPPRRTARLRPWLGLLAFSSVLGCADREPAGIEPRDDPTRAEAASGTTLVTIPVRGSCPTDGTVVTALAVGGANDGRTWHASVGGSVASVALPEGHYLFAWKPIPYASVAAQFGAHPASTSVEGMLIAPFAIESNATVPAQTAPSCVSAIYDPSQGNNSVIYSDATVASALAGRTTQISGTSFRLNPITVGNYSGTQIRGTLVSSDGDLPTGNIFRIQPISAATRLLGSPCQGVACGYDRGLMDGFAPVSNGSFELTATNPGLWLLELKHPNRRRHYNAAAWVAPGQAVVNLRVAALRSFSRTFTFYGDLNRSSRPPISAAQAGWTLDDAGVTTRDLQVAVYGNVAGVYTITILRSDTDPRVVSQVVASCSGSTCRQVSSGKTIIGSAWSADGGTVWATFGMGSSGSACVKAEVASGGTSYVVPSTGCHVVNKAGDGSTWAVPF